MKRALACLLVLVASGSGAWVTELARAQEAERTRYAVLLNRTERRGSAFDVEFDLEKKACIVLCREHANGTLSQIGRSDERQTMRVRAGIVVEDVDERGSPLTMRVRCTESTGDVNGEPHDDRLEGVDAIIAFRAGGREYQVDGHGANGSERDILEQLCDAIVSVPEMSGMEPRGPVAVGEGWQRVVDRFPATWVSDSPGVTRVGTVPVNGRVVKTEECDGLRCLRVELSLRRDGYWRGVLDVYGAIVGSRVEEDLELLVPVDGSARLPWSRRVSKWVVVSKGRDDAGGVGVCHQRYEAVSNVRMSRVPSPTGTEQLKDDRNEPNH